MTRKKGILITLLALGLVLISSGVWLMLDSAKVKVSIPEGNPVVYEKLEYIMRGEFKYLYFYEDGSIIYIEEKGLRPAGAHPTRTWSTGKLTQQQLDSLLAYLENSGLGKLEDYYQFPGEPIEDGGFRTGDMGKQIRKPLLYPSELQGQTLF